MLGAEQNAFPHQRKNQHCPSGNLIFSARMYHSPSLREVCSLTWESSSGAGASPQGAPWVDLPGALSSDAAIKHLPAPAPSIKALTVSAGLGCLSPPAPVRVTRRKTLVRRWDSLDSPMAAPPSQSHTFP